MDKSQNELESLNNAVVNMNLEGLEVLQYIQHDDRKKIGKFFLRLNGTSISPILNYDNMNHFILGMTKMKKVNPDTITFESLQESKNKLIQLFGNEIVEKMTLNEFIELHKTREHYNNQTP